MTTFWNLSGDLFSFSTESLLFWIQIIVAIYVIKFLRNYFAAENNVPTISFEVPKPTGGKFKEEVTSLLRDFRHSFTNCENILSSIRSLQWTVVIV
jgi:hypothetical protein